MTGGAEGEEEKQGLSDAEHSRKTAAHPRLAIFPEQGHGQRNWYRGYWPDSDENNEVIPSDGKSDLAFVVRAAILSINDILVWLRITGILLTYEEVGPLIRMIYLLSIVASKYLLIYFHLELYFYIDKIPI